MSTPDAHQLALTLGQRTDEGWIAVTDHGERVLVPRDAARDWEPAPGQRVQADMDGDRAVSIQVSGSSLLS